MNGSEVHCWTSGHSVICIQRTHRRESPHKLPAKLLKSSLHARRRQTGAEV